MSKSRKPPAPSEADLLAYTDGQLGAQATTQVESWLAGQPGKVAEIAAWRDQIRAIGALFPADEAQDRAAVLATRMLRQPAPDYWRALIRTAAALALLGMGAALGWGLRGPGTGSTDAVVTAALVDDAIAAHAVYTVEVLHPVEVGAAQEAHLVAWLSKRLGAEITAPDLSGSGFSLVGGRLLPSGGGAAAQFMYENAEGARITLFATCAETGQLAAFRYRERDGIGTFFWQDTDLAFALVGDLGQLALKALARQVYAQLG